MDAAGLEGLRARAAEDGTEVWTASGNIAVESDVERLFADFSAAHGGIDAVVNNAGITRDALLIKAKDGALTACPWRHGSRSSTST